MPMSQDTKDGFRVSAWVAWAVVLVCVIGVVIFAVRVLFAPQIGAGQKRINTNTGAYTEAAYDRYYDECNAIVANETRQKIYVRQLADAKKSGSPEDVQKAQTNLDAVVAVHADLVTQYNSDSSKTGTLAQHHAADLPWHINPNSEEPTTCTQ